MSNDPKDIKIDFSKLRPAQPKPSVNVAVKAPNIPVSTTTTMITSCTEGAEFKNPKNR